MPRLSPKQKNVAFFLYARDPKTGELSATPVGSGAFVSVPSKTHWFVDHVYAVTCHHCILEGGTIIRVNTSDGGSRLIETEPHDWEFPPDGGDIAVIDMTGLILQGNGDEIAVIPTTQFATKEFIKKTEIGIGEDGFMLGLFSDHPGMHRNLVAARFGNVSLLADDHEPLKQPNRRRRPMHLFDMHSRPGASGSPVLVYRTPSGDLRTAQLRGIDKRSLRRIAHDAIMEDEIAVARAQHDWRIDGIVRRSDAFSYSREAQEIEENTFLVLFGIHVGQYHDQIVAQRLTALRAEANEPILDGDHLKVPNSMALVLPAWEVLDLLMIDKLIRRREGHGSNAR